MQPWGSGRHSSSAEKLCDRCTQQGRKQCRYTPRQKVTNSTCKQCRDRTTKCVFEPGNPRCQSCSDRGVGCSYKVVIDSHRTYVVQLAMTGSSDQGAAANGHMADLKKQSEPTCVCNAVFRTESGTPEQGRRLYDKVGEIFTLEMVLDIGQAGVSMGLPFPLLQARLRLADPGNAVNMERHVVAEGEPMVLEFNAVQSLANIIAAIPETLYATVDVEAMMEIGTLRWDSMQLASKFLYRCSACGQLKCRI